MVSIQGKSIFFFLLLLTTVLLTAGCIANSNLHPSDQQNMTTTSAPVTPFSTTQKNVSIEQASEIIKTFVTPHKIDNLSYAKTITTANTTLYEFRSDTASFIVNPTTGRVQLAKWTKSGPVISGISSDVNESCERVHEFAKEKYPEIWVSDSKRDMELKTAKKWPLGYDLSYECTWYEIIYYPAKKTALPLIIRDRNSVDIFINPYTGMISSYEETNIPLRSDLDLQPTLNEDQAWEHAKQHFAIKGIINIQPSEQTSYGLYISTTEDGKQYLIYSLKVEQNRNWTTGGLVGIDAHDGHVVSHTSF
jgi:hypothetical protein